MTYVVNVDLETKNGSGRVNDCPSKLHESLGAHYDLTVHALQCPVRGTRMVNRPTRYWVDNDGHGYTFEEVAVKIRELVSNVGAHPRRCPKCGVEAHLPDWD